MPKNKNCCPEGGVILITLQIWPMMLDVKSVTNLQDSFMYFHLFSHKWYVSGVIFFSMRVGELD